MNWKKITDDLPTEDVRCLVVLSNQKSVDVLTWNAHYLVWDSADGDDYFCDRDMVDFWISFSELPTIPDKGKEDV